MRVNGMTRWAFAMAVATARRPRSVAAFAPVSVGRPHGWPMATPSGESAVSAYGGRATAFGVPRAASHTRIFQSSASTTASSDTTDAADSKPDKVPITLLAGFLGSGKTTTLQHLLENTDGVRIGLIVNDVASVNIDAKLVSADSAVSSLDSTGNGSDGVVELQNGCACCSLADELLTTVERVMTNRTSKEPLDAVVVELSGVADPVAIQTNWRQATLAGIPVTERADVTQVVTVIDSSTFGTDWMTWDVAGQRSGWTQQGDNCSGERKVPELLAEQVEAADLVLMNKIDIAGEEQTQVAASLARQLNKNAAVEEVSFGKISPAKILNAKQFKESSSATTSEQTESTQCCSNPDCTKKSHSHDHNHDHTSAEACTDPDCTDESHDHSHSHSHSHSHATSTDNLGIVNFVYRAPRPFNQRKLLTLLSAWPIPIKDELDLSLLKEASGGAYEIAGQGMDMGSPFVGVLRSKGFCWFAPTRWSGPKEDVWRHDTAMYWSHAGKHFGISSAGKWWATIPDIQMRKYFENNMGEYNRIRKEDFVSEEFGDRRQEIVFIGVNIDEDAIRNALDSCLVSEKGMNRYRQELQNWETSIFASPTGGPSLFNVGGVDHMDVD